MQSKVYEKPKQTKKNYIFSSVGVSTPSNNKLPNLKVIKTPFDTNMTEMTNKLYLSILDAKNILVEYKAKLSLSEVDEEDNITPLVESTKYPMLFYKREDLTSIKAYKVRGALYQMNKVIEEMPGKNLRFVAASTGNHALGVLKAAEILNVSNVIICISESVTEFKKNKLSRRILELKEKGINVELIIKGESFDQTNDFAQNLAELDENSFYIDPYNNHNAVAGQGTIGLEVLSQLGKRLSEKNSKLEELTVIIPVGGGGLISGISCALKYSINQFPVLKNLKLKVIGVSLKDLNSFYGDAIKVESVGSHNFSYIDYLVDKKIKIDDTDMKKGIDFVHQDINARVEGASAGTLKPVLENIVFPGKNSAVVCILSGGNII